MNPSRIIMASWHHGSSPREHVANVSRQLAALCAADLLVELSSWELKVKAEQLPGRGLEW